MDFEKMIFIHFHPLLVAWLSLQSEFGRRLHVLRE